MNICQYNKLTAKIKKTVPGYAMLMRTNKAKTAVHGYHCSGDMAMRMRKILVAELCAELICFVTQTINLSKYGCHGNVVTWTVTCDIKLLPSSPPPPPPV